MKDPTRLLASADSTDLERELLSSWDEHPTRDARAKTLAMLGVAGATTIAGAATAGASIAPKAAAGWLALAKWTAVVLAVGATAAGIGIATRHHEDAAPRATTTATAQTPAPIVTPTATVDEPVKTVELPSETRRAPQTHAPVVQPAASTLAEQVAALDRARTALDSHDGAKALQLALAYEAEYPGGAFTQEAEVVRIEALSQSGNRAEAERAGKRFLAAYPKSPHAPRVRSFLGYDP